MSTSESPENRSRRGGGGVAILALILAVAALALAGWAAFRPQPSPATSTTYGSAQTADAQRAACAAADVVRRGVSTNTNLQSPGGPGDVTGSLAVAANARLSLSGGGQYLLARLDPATPPELAAAVKQFGNDLLDIGAAATAGALNTDPDQAARLRDADTANGTIIRLCS